jgi:hypothetical protein
MFCAHIFQPTKTATQAGRAKTHHWILRLERERPFFPDSTTGWMGSAETQAQVQLAFPTSAAAIAFAESQGWAYTLHPASQPKLKPKSYSSNFISPTR